MEAVGGNVTVPSAPPHPLLSPPLCLPLTSPITLSPLAFYLPSFPSSFLFKEREEEEENKTGLECPLPNHNITHTHTHTRSLVSTCSILLILFYFMTKEFLCHNLQQSKWLTMIKHERHRGKQLVCQKNLQMLTSYIHLNTTINSKEPKPKTIRGSFTSLGPWWPQT